MSLVLRFWFLCIGAELRVSAPGMKKNFLGPPTLQLMRDKSVFFIFRQVGVKKDFLSARPLEPPYGSRKDEKDFLNILKAGPPKNLWIRPCMMSPLFIEFCLRDSSAISVAWSFARKAYMYSRNWKWLCAFVAPFLVALCTGQWIFRVCTQPTSPRENYRLRKWPRSSESKNMVSEINRMSIVT